MSTVSYLPVWKKGATPAERLRELAHVAEKYPEKFARFVLIWGYSIEGGGSATDYFADNCTPHEAMGLSATFQNIYMDDCAKGLR